eukprot:COSAG01_NODE_47048_length_394_cov_0.867797_1_plen_55_part_01
MDRGLQAELLVAHGEEVCARIVFATRFPPRSTHPTPLTWTELVCHGVRHAAPGCF